MKSLFSSSRIELAFLPYSSSISATLPIKAGVLVIAYMDESKVVLVEGTTYKTLARLKLARILTRSESLNQRATRMWRLEDRSLRLISTKEG